MKTIFFLDDERNISDVDWVNYPENHQVLNFRTCKSLINYINFYCKDKKWEDILFSLDHDLAEFDKGGNEIDGYVFAKFIVNYFIDNSISLDSLNVVCHSMNPVGRKNIEDYIFNAKLFYFN